MAEKKKQFEAVLDRLEEIVAQMESGGLSLDESMKLYEEGMKKSQELNGMLANARERVMKLVADSEGKMKIEPFDTEKADNQ